MASETAAALLEREPELNEFGNTLAEARQGRGRVVFVEAPAGLGKTTLLNAASERGAKEGFLCLRARATELERDFAYGCVRQLLEPAAATASDPEHKRLFEGAAALSEPLFTETATSLESPVADSAVSIRHGLYWLLNNLADDSPVVFAIDDLHWADAESIRFLNYLGPRLDGLPLAVLTSTRTGEAVTADVARLATGPDTTILRPRPLSIEATSTLCEQRLGVRVAEDFAAACHQATGGNPFFLEALLRQAIEQGLSTESGKAIREQRIGPREVAQAVLLRLTGAPPSATALVRAVAVLGDGANLTEAAGVAEIPEEEAAREADRLAALEILVPDERLEFAHPIVREAVYADMGSHERATAHAHAAGVLAEHGASEERIAAQAAKTEPSRDPARVEILRRVAADATARGAPSAAIAWLRRALAEPPLPEVRGEVLLELGSAELRVGNQEDAVEHLTEAVQLIEDPESLAVSSRLLANALTWSGEANRAVEALESAILVVEGSDRELALVLEAELTAHSQQASQEARAPAAKRLERHSSLKGSTPGERLVLASLAFEQARASESADQAAAHIERALAGGQLLREQDLDVAGTFYLLVYGLLATDALDLAETCWNQALSEARAAGSIPAQAFVLTHRGRVSLQRGALADAEADARTALEFLMAHEIQLGTTVALGVLIEAMTEAGEVEAGQQALTSSGVGDEIPPGLRNQPLMEARSRLRLAQGRTREGLDDLIEFGRRDELWGAANPLASRWRSRASLALATLGEGERASRMAADDLERARRWGSASGIGVALHATALVDGGAESVDRLREAAKELERSPLRLEHARALTDLGAALRRANRRAEARGTLQEGLELAERCRATELAERARTELRAAGGPSSDPEGTGVELLTVSERRVAELAANGNSNPEIAQALFVTRKTVETHLGHVYSKLDISGRGELEDALADQGPTESSET